MTTEIVCSAHGKHIINNNERLTSNPAVAHIHAYCHLLMGKSVVDSTEEDGFALIYEDGQIIKRVKVGEKLPGHKARLSQIDSISVY